MDLDISLALEFNSANTLLVSFLEYPLFNIDDATLVLAW